MTEVIKGKALRQDLALYDGNNINRQRKSSSGGYVSGLAIGDEVDVLMVHGQGQNRTQTTIQNCVNSLGSLNRSIKFSPGTWTIESNTTVPANLTAIIPAGVVFSISSGITLAFSGPVKTDSDNFKSGSGTLTYTDDRMLQSVAGTNTVTASTLSGLTVLKDGQEFFIVPASTCTGAVTVNVNSTGAVNARKNQSGGLVALVANDFIANNLYRLIYKASGPYYIVSNLSAYAQGADVASATTINLDTATGDYIHVTGTTQIDAVTLAKGQERTIVFDDALTFSNGASLLLPGAASITTAAGDTAVLRGEASGVVRCITYTPKAVGPAELTLLNGLTSIATQATQETGTSETALVVTGRQQYHPSAAKGWIDISVATNAPADSASYNVSSVADSGTGVYTVSWATDFSSANYAVLATVEQILGALIAYTGSKLAGSVIVTVFNISGSGPTYATTDDSVSVVAFGDQ